MDPTPWWPERLADASDVRDRLLAAYADPARGYHDTTHLAEVLVQLDRMAADLPERDAVVLAAWFHDAVYDGAGDDEERSARLAETELAAAGADPDLVAEVARLVRLTERHDPAPDDLAGRLLCDADLAILAAPAARYEDYVRGVRRDYAHVPDAAFRAGRRQVLLDLLARPRLFLTDDAHDRFEEAARANLAAEVARLDGSEDDVQG